MLIGGMPHPAGGGGGGTDDWFKNVVLLSGFEGSDGSTSFTDESQFARTLTAGGNAQIDTAQAKFGSSSLLLDGVGDYFTAAASEDFNFGYSNWTMELWVRWPVAPLAGMDFVAHGTTGQAWHFYWDTRLKFAVGGSTVQETGVWSPTAGTWYHIVAERSGNTIRLYRDGAMVGKATLGGLLGSFASVVSFGIYPNLTSGPLNANVDDERITYGIARYDSDAGYEVPTAAFPRTAAAETGDYRYYKFLLSGPNDGTKVALFIEIAVAESNGGADVGRCARVTGSADKFAPTQGPGNAINDFDGDGWQPDITISANIVFDFFTKRTLHEAIFTPHASFLGRTPNQIQVQGSNDGSSWTTIHTFTGLTGWTGARTLQW